ncbi:putative cyclin-B3-1 [Iris pallida]|uniref:Cyclin-B3-1 n=1 Tax=Iris pallida TaxID=29817 RepID=A0AAX6DNH5_IRIPA|nr:putative cyclin-B3-1 [Iris pallida]
MVSFKGKPTKLAPIRVFDENAAPKNAKDFKMHSGTSMIRAGVPARKSIPTVGASCAVAAARNDPNGGKGKTHGMGNTTGKCDNSVKTRIGRKALADVSNLDNDQSYRRKNQLSNNPKIVKDKPTRSIAQGKSNSGNFPYKPRISLTKSFVVANVSNKSIRESVKSSVKEGCKRNIRVDTSTTRKMSYEINSSSNHLTKQSRGQTKLVCRGHEANHSNDTSKLIKNHGVKLLRPRLSFTAQKAIAGNPSLKKSIGTIATCTHTNSRPRTPHVKHKSAVEKCSTTKPCVKGEAEPSGSSCDDHGPINSQGCDADKVQFDGSQCSNETVTLVISRSKRSRRKSYTSSLVAKSEILGDSANFVKKDELPIIDDQTNPLEVVEYVDDIYQYYWTTEVQNPLPANYMTLQSDITPKMRGILINWLIEVHHKFQLMQETLFLMVDVLDRVLSILPVKKDELQMVGLTALLLASKYEDYWHPKINELISISANLYTRDQMLDMEKLILRELRFRLNVPTPYVFMLRFLKAAQSDKKLENLAFYLIELCLVEYEALKYRPSLLCASAIYVARCTLQMTPPWTGLLSKYARYKESQLRHLSCY